MANGTYGPVPQFFLELILKAGMMLGANRLEPIEAAYVNTTFTTTETHHDLLDWLVEEKVRVAVPTYTNVSVLDIDLPDLRVGPTGQQAVDRSRSLIEMHRRIGCKLSLTCAPYQLPRQPGFGAQIAVSESNAISYFNSVVGARTLKYGDYLDMAAAVTGRAPYCGLHTREGRHASVVFEVESLPLSLAEDDLAYQLVGHAMGRKTAMEVPALAGLPPGTTKDNLRSICATGASAGGVAMYHAIGFTPEAPNLETATGGKSDVRCDVIRMSDLVSAKAELTGFSEGPIDAVVLGTPHASKTELRVIANLFEGRKRRPEIAFYVQTNRYNLEQGRQDGTLERLHASGVTVVADTCLYWRPLTQGVSGRVMTNSGKFAYYSPGELNIQVTLGSLRECVESAIRGAVWHDPDLAIVP